MVPKLLRPLLILWIAISVPTILTLTTPADPPIKPRVISGPGLLPAIRFDKDVVDCSSSLAKIDGCITQIYEAFYKNQVYSVGPSCCKTIKNNINNNCWDKMFPFYTKFLPLVKNHCANFATP